MHARLTSFLVLSLLVVACGGADATSTSDGTPSAAPSASDAPPGDVTPAPSSAPAPAPATNDPSATAPFVPSEVLAKRFPITCGVDPAPFVTGDLYSLQALGTKAKGTPYTSLSVGLHTSAEIGKRYPLVIKNDDAEGQEATATIDGDRVVDLVFSRGVDPAEIDATAFDEGAVTVVAFPTKDGETLSTRVELHFRSGRVLDVTLAGSLTSSNGGCGGG